MATARERTDPVAAFNFYISLLDSTSTLATAATGINLAAAAGGFSECTGLDASIEIEEYKEGGQNAFVHKFPTRITYSNIVLKRGIGFSEDLWNWHFSYVSGKGKRRDGIICLQNESRAPVKAWAFRRGLPLKWVGPQLNASQSVIAIESIEIAHEGLELLTL